MVTATRFETVSQEQGCRLVADVRDALRQLEAGRLPVDRDGSVQAGLSALEARARRLRRRGGPYATVCLSSQTEALRAMLESESCSGLVPATDG